MQFFDEGIVDVCEALAQRGVRVIVGRARSGLPRASPSGRSPSLLAVAEYVTKLHAVCAKCGAHATRSQRLAAKEGQLFVGGAAAYEARCRACFSPNIAGG